MIEGNYGFMLYERMIATGERAGHFASWELTYDWGQQCLWLSINFLYVKYYNKEMVAD